MLGESKIKWQKKPLSQTLTAKKMASFYDTIAPKNTHYETNGDVLYLVPNTDSMQLSGFDFDFTPEQLKILGVNPTMNQIFNYVYESGNPVRLKAKKRIKVNGKSYPVEKLHFSAYSNDENIEICLMPLFAYRYNFRVGEVSMDIDFFATLSPTDKRTIYTSVGNLPMNMTVNIEKSTNGTLKAIMQCELEPVKAQSAKQILDLLIIWKGIINRECEIDGCILDGIQVQQSNVAKLNEAIKLWGKIAQIEQIVGHNFHITSDAPTLSKEELYTINELYLVLVKRLPIRVSATLNSIDVDDEQEKIFKEREGKDVLFPYMKFYNLWNVQMCFPALFYLDKVNIRETICANNKKKILLNETVQTCLSYFVFNDQNELNNYDISQIKFDSAKYLREYMAEKI